jgi:hypothetical protein
LYFVRQTADGYVDRQAVGAEVRYFDAHLSGFGLLDYDIMLRSMNIAMAQGTYRFDFGSNVHALVDRRKAPFLQLTNVLPAVPGPPPTYTQSLSIADALLNSGVSLSQLREYTKLLAAESSLYNVGVNHPLNDKWQIGGDINVTSLSSTRGAGIVPPQIASGTAKAFSLQVIANNALLENNTDVLNMTYINAPTYTGQNYSFNHVSQMFENRLRFDLSLRYYVQNDASQARLWRFSPTLRVSYRILPNVSLEGEGGKEVGHQTDAQGTKTDSTRRYYYLGYRWDWL